jgi:hypothetical protein
MTINFKFNLKAIDGSELANCEANKLLSSLLLNLNSGNSIKLYDWAIDLYKKGTLDIDRSDVEILKAIIEKSESLTVLAKAPMLLAINKAEE